MCFICMAMPSSIASKDFTQSKLGFCNRLTVVNFWFQLNFFPIFTITGSGKLAVLSFKKPKKPGKFIRK